MLLDQIESIMNDFIQLKALSKVDEAETMVEGELLSISLNCSKLPVSVLILCFASVGTLDGFSFDSEDEAEKITKVASSPADQNEPVEGLNTKSKNKAEKSSVCFYIQLRVVS